jgi:hypothetical protein
MDRMRRPGQAVSARRVDVGVSHAGARAADARGDRRGAQPRSWPAGPTRGCWTGWWPPSIGCGAAGARHAGAAQRHRDGRQRHSGDDHMAMVQRVVTGSAPPRMLVEVPGGRAVAGGGARGDGSVRVGASAALQRRTAAVARPPRSGGDRARPPRPSRQPWTSHGQRRRPWPCRPGLAARPPPVTTCVRRSTGVAWRPATVVRQVGGRATDQVAARRRSRRSRCRRRGSRCRWARLSTPGDRVSAAAITLRRRGVIYAVVVGARPGAHSGRRRPPSPTAPGRAPTRCLRLPQCTPCR